MPTGYTADLCDGKPQTFPEFAMNCARAFGALIELRDSPEAEIPDEFQPSEYHTKTLNEYRAKLADAEGWDADRIEAEYAAAVERTEAYNREGRERAAVIRDRCEAMLAQVDAWEPPTEDHKGLQTFMRDQITGTIDFDGKAYESPVPTDVDVWFADHLNELRRMVASYEKSEAEDRQRAAERTAWVRSLRASLTTDAPS